MLLQSHVIKMITCWKFSIDSRYYVVTLASIRMVMTRHCVLPTGDSEMRYLFGSFIHLLRHTSSNDSNLKMPSDPRVSIMGPDVVLWRRSRSSTYPLLNLYTQGASRSHPPLLVTSSNLLVPPPPVDVSHLATGCDAHQPYTIQLTSFHQLSMIMHADTNGV